jgi:sodium transport system ATP-binding protein
MDKNSFGVRVTNLTKSYQDLKHGEFLAVDHISFKAEQGRIFGLLGPNGAGKSTTLRILATMLTPSRGRVLVNGYDVSTDPDSVRQSIGFVSNNTAIYDRMTAWETVEFFGRLHGLTKDNLNEQGNRLFDRLNLNDIRHVVGAKMSTGMKQKVSIARALIHSPPVLIFDEASIGLDVLVARSLLEIIAELKHEGHCIIFSTHIMREVERLCDEVAIMYRGRILDHGTLPELADRHHQPDFEELFIQLLRAAEKPTIDSSSTNQASFVTLEEPSFNELVTCD